MRVAQRRVSDRHEGELRKRDRTCAAHQLRVSEAHPQEGNDRLKQGQHKSQDKRVVTGLDDHRVTPCVLAESFPPCQTPCFFKASATSRGM